MTQRGRKSALKLVPLDATGIRPKLTPPRTLSKSEAELFVATVANNPHLSTGDAPLLACYVQGLAKGQRLARSRDVAAWEKCMRVVLSMATKLRLTPQSLHPDTVARRKRDQPPPSYYELDSNDDDDN